MNAADFRPPLLKNIAGAFAAPTVCTAAVCLLLFAVTALFFWPVQLPVQLACGIGVAAAMLLFWLYSTAKRPAGMHPAVPGLLCVFCCLPALAATAAGAVCLLWPAYLPIRLFKAICTAAYIKPDYAAWVFWILLVLAAGCLFGFALFFGSVRRTLRDGIPRRRFIGCLCFVTVLTAAVFAYLSAAYLLSGDPNAILRFHGLSFYHYITVLPSVFFVFGTGLFCIACLQYSGAVKRSVNV